MYKGFVLKPVKILAKEINMFNFQPNDPDPSPPLKFSHIFVIKLNEH